MEAKKRTCLKCGKVMDASTPVGNNDLALPEAGSLSICGHCGNLAIYEKNPDGDLYLRQPTGDEMAAIGADDDVMRAVAAVRKMIKERNG